MRVHHKRVFPIHVDLVEAAFSNQWVTSCRSRHGVLAQPAPQALQQHEPRMKTMGKNRKTIGKW